MHALDCGLQFGVGENWIGACMLVFASVGSPLADVRADCYVVGNSTFTDSLSVISTQASFLASYAFGSINTSVTWPSTAVNGETYSYVE